MNKTDNTRSNESVAEIGVALKAFLSLVIVVNGFLTLTFLLGINKLQEIVPGVSLTSKVLYGIFNIINVIAAIAIWKMKKWGVIAIVVSALSGFFYNILVLNHSVAQSSTGIILPLVLLILLRSKWKYMK